MRGKFTHKNVGKKKGTEGKKVRKYRDGGNNSHQHPSFEEMGCESQQDGLAVKHSEDLGTVHHDYVYQDFHP